MTKYFLLWACSFNRKTRVLGKLKNCSLHVYKGDSKFFDSRIILNFQCASLGNSKPQIIVPSAIISSSCFCWSSRWGWCRSTLFEAALLDLPLLPDLKERNAILLKVHHFWGHKSNDHEFGEKNRHLRQIFCSDLFAFTLINSTSI